MLVDKTLLSVRLAASKDGNRPTLRAIRIRKKGKLVTATATDSYVFCEITKEVPDTLEYPKLSQIPIEADEVLLPASIAQKLSSAMSANELLPILSYGVVGEDRATVTDLNESTTLGFIPPEGEYPKTLDKDIKAYEQKKYAVLHLNPKYLRAVLEIFRDEGTIEIAVPIEDKMAPAFIRSEANGTKKTALVMPLRGDA